MLYYYGARYYNPKTGRFITSDWVVPNPLNSQSFNRYSYVQNNPVNFLDPSGNNSVDVQIVNAYYDPNRNSSSVLNGYDPNVGYAGSGGTTAFQQGVLTNLKSSNVNSFGQITDYALSGTPNSSNFSANINAGTTSSNINISVQHQRLGFSGAAGQFATGAGSYFKGIYGYVRFGYRLSGLGGSEERSRA